jgi:hypothetical protein
VGCLSFSVAHGKILEAIPYLSLQQILALYHSFFFYENPWLFEFRFLFIVFFVWESLPISQSLPKHFLAGLRSGRSFDTAFSFNI